MSWSQVRRWQGRGVEHDLWFLAHQPGNMVVPNTEPGSLREEGAALQGQDDKLPDMNGQVTAWLQARADPKTQVPGPSTWGLFQPQQSLAH